ncbi:MAG: methyltransferase domain-containing protein [Planctomycetes bacterium]|nr:methyltransferase domain-containing protein [Nannocystis sp.]MBA3546995.1 methyltransferase domain-containing protein [Nannocystis sp.]MBA3846134.1 methyltransferase domain-containing protein [Planctomycetota bacterium]
MTDQTLAIQQRYGAAALAVEPALCCPVTYDPKLLRAIPAEVVERDYGCGDPSSWVRTGETVLDLGSGGGKICFIASQIVGSAGQVIGVDRNRDMLALARDATPRVAKAIGYGNVAFRCGAIQDLALDLEAVEGWLARHPVRTREELFALEAEQDRLRRESPMIADGSVDVVVSNCVLNLVGERDRRQLFAELFRVVRIGGRVAISDIVCDEDVPEHLRSDPALWSGCISGAFREDRFLQAFADAGFHGVHLAKRDERPWRVVEGIEYRSVTVVAYKGKQGPCLEGNHAVLYPGPWSEVRDDDGHVFRRGERTAVCAKTYRLLTSEPYAAQVIGLPPYQAVPEEQRRPFACDGQRPRHPRETKNGELPADWRPDGTSCAPGCC